MSRWVERILKEFPADLSRLWIAADPDGVLLDERILSSLRDRGFDVVPFEDSIVFRTEYEERYRLAWDSGDAAPASALILHLREISIDALPWDYLRQGRKVSLSLADLFSKLSYGVIRQIGSEHHESLFDAQTKHAPQTLGEGATKDFILTHIFGISPYLLSRPEDFWREVLRLHYRGEGMPSILASHVAGILGDRHALADLPVADLLSSKSYMVRVVQKAWNRFLATYGVRIQNPTKSEQDSEYKISIPFEHPDIRVIVDTMFPEGTLHPVTIQGSSAGIPDWAKAGIVEDPNTLRELVADGASKIADDLPGLDASHREWTQLARRLGEVIFRFHSLSQEHAAAVATQVHDLQRKADDRLKEWIFKHYTDLPSLPAAKEPVMVHHVPRFLAMRRSAGEDRIALLVFDGLAMDQWIQIREHLEDRAPTIITEEGACFAWLPTLTSVSRQALFSGLKPREFANSIETTSKEPSLWSQFWQDNGLRKNEVFYQKSIKMPTQLPDIESAISNPTIKVAGIVVDMIDEIVHGATLGKRGITSQISDWCDTGFIENLFSLLATHGYQIYLTADHGNVEAVGIGRLSQGVVSELRGERVRTYRSEPLADSAPEEIDAFRFDVAGLPTDFLPLYAGTRGAFVTAGDQIVAHGGTSVEELIVPFIKIKITSTDS